MPKMKTKKSATKRFKKTGTGKIMHHPGGHRHLASRKSQKRKRRLRKAVVIASSMQKRNDKMI
jgi:large subunit ribosomal protein L35|tara:strand:- start:82 stop:270 length:189 start_codon:yes stop_codon:yes gene_type:complete